MATNNILPTNYNSATYNNKVSGNEKTSGTTTSLREPKQDLGKDEFLKILSMQMANQDPLEPMKDTEFIAQMAQFSSLEQMQALNGTIEGQSAYSLMGKNVLANVKDSGGVTNQIYGEVVGVMSDKGVNYLQIGEYYVPLDAVITVYDDSTLDDLVTKAASLSGKYIEAEVPPEKEGAEATAVYGKIETIIIKNGMLHAKLEGVDKEVPVAYIKKVSDIDLTPPETETPETPETPEDGDGDGEE